MQTFIQSPDDHRERWSWVQCCHWVIRALYSQQNCGLRGNKFWRHSGRVSCRVHVGKSGRISEGSSQIRNWQRKVFGYFPASIFILQPHCWIHHDFLFGILREINLFCSPDITLRIVGCLCILLFQRHKGK